MAMERRHGDKAASLRKTLSANIKKHREQSGLTQEKLAEALKVETYR